MRRDDLYLNDIIEAADHITAFLPDTDFDVAFRNILIQAYFGIDWNEVWKPATVDCPALRGPIALILTTEFGESAGENGS